MRAVPPSQGGEEESPAAAKGRDGLERYQRQRFRGPEMLPAPCGGWRMCAGVEVVAVGRSESNMAYKEEAKAECNVLPI